MKHWKIILGILGIFLLGMIAGGLLTLRIEHRLFAKGPDAWARLVIRRLSFELRLDANQRAQLTGTCLRTPSWRRKFSAWTPISAKKSPSPPR